MTSVQPLAAGFPAPTEDDWRTAALARGGSRNADTAPSEREGGPLHQRKIGARPIVGRPTGRPWRIVERVDTGSADEAASAASEAFAGGATGLELVLPSSLHPMKRTVAGEANDIARMLTSIVPRGAHLRIDAGNAGTAALEPFLRVAADHAYELVWAYDPVAARAIRGTALVGDDASIKTAAVTFAHNAIGGAVIIADGRMWHAGGASEEQELGITLATYVNHIRLLDSADRIGVALAVDADQFRGIAKLRAMRLLVARVIEIAGLSSPPPPLHAETAWRMMSVRDPEMNIVRTTSAAFAAAVGGADSLTVLPFDAATDRQRTEARRLARNTQIILADEANLHRIGDPGAGSGAIEALTAAFAEAAWKRFQTIEAEGGMMAAIAEGSLLREVAEAREARLARVARGDIKLIGVNAFRGEATTATVKRAPVKRTGPLTFKRLSVPFEVAP